MKDSKIEWTHHTFNPWWGCVKVSPGCQNCYAEAFSKRTGHAIWGTNSLRRTFGDKHWNEPKKWNAAAEAAGERKRVFCASMADVFEERADLDPHRERLFNLIVETKSLDWLLLTKRPAFMAKWIGGTSGAGFVHLEEGEALENVWLGVTVENQEQAMHRVPILLEIPARVRFLSCEPLLGPIDLRHIEDADGNTCDALTGNWGIEGRGHTGPSAQRIHWVIAGGESGPKSRPIHPAWVRKIRDQCQAAHVPFLFKQWGEYAYDLANPIATKHPGKVCYPLERVGKSMAGRILDSQEHLEFPSAKSAAEGHQFKS
ncbi:protein gp37 [Haloferula luteola]|uniref:Protein gp37 n=1 Tax=Haloferula luteola TaxID=595692 RepID=A0A840V639_9BACT|nr:phage Gp37/Gp68 family protein [Haloferula luteola]MBB5351094.1 protein gp37 [Haloferula luteola]